MGVFFSFFVFCFTWRITEAPNHFIILLPSTFARFYHFVIWIRITHPPPVLAIPIRYKLYHNTHINEQVE